MHVIRDYVQGIFFDSLRSKIYILLISSRINSVLKGKNEIKRMADIEMYQESIKTKIIEAEELIQKCKELYVRDGHKKLQKRIEAELKFLSKLSKHPDRIKKEHLRCSNLSHLSAILFCAASEKDVIEVLKPFSYVICNRFLEAQQKRVVVDIVSDGGHSWVKVVARKAEALAQSSLGNCEFGRRTILEQLEDMTECRKQNPYMYQTVNFKVWFASGVTNFVKETIEKLGIEVLTNQIYDDRTICTDYETNDINMLSLKKHNLVPEKTDTSGTENLLYRSQTKLESPHEIISQDLPHKENFSPVDVQNIASISLLPEAALNLDVSSMIAYVSALTNGLCNVKFTENILTEQAEREREFHVKNELDKLFEGRKLICCKTALKDFTSIISIIGGKEEKSRAEELLARLTVVMDQPSQQVLSLQKSSKIKNRPMIIFGTGDNLQAITVSSNKGFVRAAEGQGVKLVVYLHESRALTESKDVLLL